MRAEVDDRLVRAEALLKTLCDPKVRNCAVFISNGRTDGSGVRCAMTHFDDEVAARRAQSIIRDRGFSSNLTADGNAGRTWYWVSAF